MIMTRLSFWRSLPPNPLCVTRIPQRHEARSRRAALTYLLGSALLVGVSLWSSQLHAAAKAQPASPPARPPDCAEQHLIPIAKETGISCMTQQEYDAYVKPMHHLPEMPKAYVFGRTIPQPKTDKHGHIHLSGATAAAPADEHK